MQLLFEEFFKKAYNVSKGNTNSILLIFIIRGMFYLLILILIGLIFYSIITGRYIILLFLSGVLIIGEIAHYLRKSRERVHQMNAPKDASRAHVYEMLNIDMSNNKKLLQLSKNKNKNLLNKNKKSVKVSKNKNLLNKNKKSVKVSKNKNLLK